MIIVILFWAAVYVIFVVLLTAFICDFKWSNFFDGGCLIAALLGLACTLTLVACHATVAPKLWDTPHEPAVTSRTPLEVQSLKGDGCEYQVVVMPVVYRNSVIPRTIYLGESLGGHVKSPAVTFVTQKGYRHGVLWVSACSMLELNKPEAVSEPR